VCNEMFEFFLIAMTSLVLIIGVIMTIILAAIARDMWRK